MLPMPTLASPLTVCMKVLLPVPWERNSLVGQDEASRRLKVPLTMEIVSGIARILR